MNTRILLLALSVAAFSSCSSVYKSGQTPDDVYYSPARPQPESYVDAKKEKEAPNYQTYEQYQDSYRDQRFLRMSIGNPYYLNAYNSYSGFDWRYNSFYDGYNYGFNSPWNNYFAWNNFYNPYTLSYGGFYGMGLGYSSVSYGYGGGYYSGGNVKYATTYNTPISRPLTFNVNNYSNSNRPASRNYSTGSYYNNNQRYNNGNSNGSSNRTYYNNSSTNNHPSYSPSNSNSNTYTPSRSYTPAPSSSSSSGSSSGGGGISRPGRGN